MRGIEPTVPFFVCFDFTTGLCDTVQGFGWNQEEGIKEVAADEFVKIPKREYQLLKEVFKNAQRQAFLLQIAEAEQNLKAGNTKKTSIDDLISSI